MRSQFIHMWQQKATPEGLTEEAHDVGWPESQHHLPQRWQKWGLRLSAIILSICLPMIAGREESRGEPWLISGIFYHSDGILFVFSDKFYFFPLPSGAVSSAWKPSLHPVLKYIILPIQICQRLYYICISNLIKSFSGWHFFLEGNFKLNIFCLVISLSLFFQANFTLRLQITSCWERGHSPQLPSSPPGCAEGCLCISHPGPSLTENLLQALWNIFTAHVSQVDCCFCWMLVNGAAPLMPQRSQGWEIHSCLHLGMCLSSVTLLLVSFATKETGLVAAASAWKISLWEAVTIAYIQHSQKEQETKPFGSLKH